MNWMKNNVGLPGTEGSDGPFVVKSRPRKGRPSPAEITDLPRRITDVAWGLFIRDGFDGVTMSDIAAAGGFSKRTIYDRFDSKDALFVAAVELYVGDGVGILSAPAPSARLRERLHGLAEQLMTFAASDEIQLIECLTGLDKDRFPRINEIMEDGYRASVAAIEAIIANAMDDGAVVVGDVNKTVRCWLDLLTGHMRIFRRFDSNAADLRQNLDQWLDTLVEMFFRMCVAGEAS